MRQTTMAAATARPARKPRAQSSRRSWAIILAGEAIERVYKPGSKLILFFLVEKLQQLAIEYIGNLQVRYVAYAFGTGCALHGLLLLPGEKVV
jgi:hypothetical protein